VSKPQPNFMGMVMCLQVCVHVRVCVCLYIYVYIYFPFPLPWSNTTTGSTKEQRFFMDLDSIENKKKNPLIKLQDI